MTDLLKNLRVKIIGIGVFLVGCSVSPETRLQSSSDAKVDGATNDSNVGRDDGADASKDGGSNNSSDSGFNCNLNSSETSVIFGSAVTLSLSSSENPDSVSIDGRQVDPSTKTIRYTPQMGGENIATAVVISKDKRATCSVSVVAKPPAIPESSTCTPTYQTRGMGTFGVWLGADVAHAFNLSSNRTLSLFGDTYLGPVGSTTRAGSQMVGNTIGISSCEGGVFKTTLHWWGTPKSAQPFFKNSDKSFDRYWATNLPWRNGSILYVPLSAIQATGGGAMGFRSLRTDVAIITNPDALPSAWQITYKTLFNISNFSSPTSQGSTNFWGGVYNVPFGDFVYFYNNSGNDVTMSRIPLDTLSKEPLNPSGLLQYLAKDGTWKPGYLDVDAKRLGMPANTSLSVRYNFKQKKWFMIYFDTSYWISPKIYLRKADRLEGPWSEKIAVYDVPEVSSGMAGYDKRNFCYQAFEHLEFNPDPDNQLALTYSCNADDTRYVLGNMNIYFPKFVKIPIPQ